MDARGLPAAVQAAAGDRRGGAMEVAATALDGLLEVAADPPRLEQAVAHLLAGQPAMAPIWHLAQAARGPDPAAALTGLRRRLSTDADAAVAAATAWLRARLAATPGGVATVSHSSLVARVLVQLGSDPGPPQPSSTGAWVTRTPRIVGPLHGRVAQSRDRSAGSSTAPGTGPPVVGVVGADAIGPEALLNADGTGELAARLPTLVVATAVKLVPGAVFEGLGGPGFEVVPLAVVAAVTVGPEVLSPAEAGRRARELAAG